MKALLFQASRFAWRPEVRSQEEAEHRPRSGEQEGAVVVFLHVEIGDIEEPERSRRLRRAAKYVKWLANKKGLRRVVLHSFAHLGGLGASPVEARAWIEALAQRLGNVGYETSRTPFGWSCGWNLDVDGDPLAKVYVEVR